MSFRILNKQARRELDKVPDIFTPVTVAQRLKLLYPDPSEHYKFEVTARKIIFKTKDNKVEVATYPVSLSGFIMFVYEMDVNIATALMYYAEGGV